MITRRIRVLSLLFIFLIISCQSNSELIDDSRIESESSISKKVSFMGIFLSVEEFLSKKVKINHLDKTIEHNDFEIIFNYFEILKDNKGDSRWYLIASPEIRVDILTIQNSVLLLLAEVPDGVYSKLRFSLKHRTISNKNKGFSVSQTKIINLPLYFTLSNGRVAEIKLKVALTKQKNGLMGKKKKLNPVISLTNVAVR